MVVAQGGNARKLLAADASIPPGPDKNLLGVQTPGMACNATGCPRLPLIEQFNEMRTVGPGTDMRLVCEQAGELHAKGGDLIPVGVLMSEDGGAPLCMTRIGSRRRASQGQRHLGQSTTNV